MLISDNQQYHKDKMNRFKVTVSEIKIKLHFFFWYSELFV